MPPPPPAAPKAFRGATLDFAIRQPPWVFLVYGGRYLVEHDNGLRLDLGTLLVPPNRAWVEEIRWARVIGRILYVENAHLTYASATLERNAYLTAVDVGSGKIRWRSPALVANADTFVIAGDYIVSGYGFTAEPDNLYLLDRRTGRIVDRLAVPSAPDAIRLRGDRLHVRTYDRRLVVRIAR